MMMEDLFTSITLERFGEAETDLLIKNTLGIKEVPASLVSLIFSETEGNPFFIKEVLLTLVKTKVIHPKKLSNLTQLDIDQIKIPNSIKDVLNARIELGKSKNSDKRDNFEVLE